MGRRDGTGRQIMGGEGEGNLCRFNPPSGSAQMRAMGVGCGRARPVPRRVPASIPPPVRLESEGRRRASVRSDGPLLGTSRGLAVAAAVAPRRPQRPREIMLKLPSCFFPRRDFNHGRRT